MVFPGVGKRQEERINLAINRKAKILGRRKILETFCPSTCIKRKGC
jgi:hypothetical protein